MGERVSDDFLYELDDRLELEEELKINQYYDQLLVLTAIASYNREEGLGKIRGKQALMGEQDINIHIHCLAYEAALIGWKRFFNNEISLEDFCRNVHRVLLNQTSQIDSRVVPGETRKGTVYIGGKDEGVINSEFIYPPANSIKYGFKVIEGLVNDLLRNKAVDTKLISGYIHYLLVKLHPFQDGNGRLSRIMAITFLECFGEKDARGFTFFSEMLLPDNKNGVTYGDIFNTPEEKQITDKIKKGGLERIYHQDGTNSFEGNSNMSFSDYIDFLDIDGPAKNFKKILNIGEKNKEMVAVVVETFLKAKSLGGDHILIWKFISKLFDTVGIIINSQDTCTLNIDKETINSVITAIDGKLKRSSVKNLLILVNHLKGSLRRVGIDVEIHDSFFQKSLELGILPSDIVTKRIQEKFMEIMSED